MKGFKAFEPYKNAKRSFHPHANHAVATRTETFKCAGVFLSSSCSTLRLGTGLQVALVLQGEGQGVGSLRLRAPACLCKGFTRSALPLALSLWWMVIFIGLLMLNEPCTSCLNWTHFMVFDFGASHYAQSPLLPLVTQPPNHSPPAALLLCPSEWKALFTFAASRSEAPRGA